ncbi:MAG: NAD(P)H-binding protein [Parvibaculum sp.]
MTHHQDTQTIALVAGATGLVGSHLVEQLLASSRIGKVIALTRKPLALQHAKLENRIVDYNELEKQVAAFKLSADEAYCALGTTIKKAGSQEAFRKVDFDYETAFARAAQAAGVTKIALVSSVGANARSGIFYTRVKGETEQAIRALHFPSLQIFRPGVLLGDRREARPAEQLAVKLTPLINLTLQGPLKNYRGVHAANVAKAMVASLGESPSTHIHHYAEIMRAK